MDLEDIGYHALLQNMRDLRPTMRLVLIPLMGEDLPAEAIQVGIQGTLSKPFFADDLLPSIEDALARSVRTTATAPTPTPASPTPAPTPPQPVEEAAGDVQGVLSDLAYETQASAILLISSDEGRERVIAHVSTLDGRGLEAFMYLIFAAVQAAQAASRFLGQPDEPFEHNMFENQSLRLYIIVLPQNLLLVTITPVTTPLGTIRHNLRRAGRILSSSALT
jgi:hypothetical protein